MKTEDLTTDIVYRNSEYTEYVNTDGKRWRIYGICNACGMCELYDPSTKKNDRVVHTNYKKINSGTKEVWTRTLIWKKPPGTPNACIEENYADRLDIPMLPEAVNEISECTLTGEYVNGD